MSELRAAHALADHATEPKSRLLALAALSRAYSRAPREAAALSLRQDLTARLANLSRVSGEPREALSWARRGLDEGGAASAMKAQLWIELGEAEVALEHNAAAKKALVEAMKVNEELMLTELGKP
jgi:hypothetical protein